MQTKFVSDQGGVNAFVKEVVALCNNAEDLIKNITYIFNALSVTFLSSEVPSTKQLREIFISLLKYELDSSKLETFADQVYLRFNSQSAVISMIPRENIIEVVNSLWSCSYDIPRWAPALDKINTKDSSVESVIVSLRKTIEHIFSLFGKINKILEFLNDESLVNIELNESNTIKSLPVSIQECPKVVCSSRANTPPYIKGRRVSNSFIF
jgi:hypothetical protein